MKSHPRRTRALAASLAALAGFVDASGFILLGGFFVSFMSGNSTRLGVSLATDPSQAVVAATLLVTFVGGVILGSSIGRLTRSHRRPAVLLAVALLLGAAALLAQNNLRAFAGVAMAMAMGAENAVFETDGEVRFGLTYMTGTLVKLGQQIVAAFLGGDRFGWAPYLLLWMGLAGGGVAGAFTSSKLGLGVLWIAAAGAAALTIVAALMGPDPPTAIPAAAD